MPLLADRPWHLPQQEQDVFGVGQRGGPHEDHQHAAGWQHRTGAQQAQQGCQGWYLLKSKKKLAEFFFSYFFGSFIFACLSGFIQYNH